MFVCMYCVQEQSLDMQIGFWISSTVHRGHRRPSANIEDRVRTSKVDVPLDLRLGHVVERLGVRAALALHELREQADEQEDEDAP